MFGVPAACALSKKARTIAVACLAYQQRPFATGSPLHEFYVDKYQYVRYSGRRKRKPLMFYSRNAYGHSNQKIRELPHCDKGLTQDQIVQKALAFYRVNDRFRTQPIEDLRLPAVPSLPPSKSYGDAINPEFYNRNPRNMELLNLEAKKEGWELERKRRDYYNRLIFERSSAHTKAYVEHVTGRIIVSASTEEFAISKYLYRNTDTSAAHNIGRVLARRMLETGIIFVYCEYSDEERKTQKVGKFLQALVDSGIQLQEGERVRAPELFTGKEDYKLGPLKPDILEHKPVDGVMGHGLDDFVTIYK